MKLSDYLAQFFAARGAETVFAISGAANIRLLDSFQQNGGYRLVCPHHEQAGVMASLTYHRLSGKPGISTCTAGPGATNTATGVASAFLDSIPAFVIAGQEKAEYLTPENQLRGKGVQGLDMVAVMKPITKYAVCVRRAADIRQVLERAWYEAHSGRPGPVWVEIPQDLQWTQVDPTALDGFTPPHAEEERERYQRAARQTVEWLAKASRPLFWTGHGVRLAGAVAEHEALLQRAAVPSLVAWNAIDLVPNDHPMYAGRAGTYGQRAANFALQNCDLLICLGTRLAIPQVGYSEDELARGAKKVVVEIDPAELGKFKKPHDLSVRGDVKHFIAALFHEASGIDPWRFQPWIEQIKAWQRAYPPTPEEWKQPLPGKINSYHFIDTLSDELAASDVIATDMGTSLTCTHAAIRLKRGQRLVTSTGLGEMGFGLPAAIGACLGSKRRTVFIGTEGSLMMNLQELQTVVHHRLPLKIFILNNNAYLTIQHTERALFGDAPERLVACGPESGVSFPDLGKVSQAFGLGYQRITDAAQLRSKINEALVSPGPMFTDVMMPSDQFLGPKSGIKLRPDGSIYSPPLEDLMPFLRREELEKNMLIPLLGQP